MFDDKCPLLPLAVHYRGIREVQRSCFKAKVVQSSRMLTRIADSKC